MIALNHIALWSTHSCIPSVALQTIFIAHIISFVKVSVSLMNQSINKSELLKVA